LGNSTNIALAGGATAVNGLELAGGVNAAYNILTDGRANPTTIGYALKNVSGDNTWSGNLTASGPGGGYGILSDAGTLTISGGITASFVTTTRIFDFAGAGNFSIGGSITDGAASVALTKDGAGTLTITGNSNNYTGATTVSGGKLVINGNISTSTLTTVNTGATLGGSGTVGALTVASGGTLAPGNSIESLGAGNVSFAANSTFAYELNSASLDADLLDSTGTLDITPGAILTLAQAASGSLAIGSKLTLISYFGGWTGSELFTYLDGTLNDGAIFTLGSNDWQFDYDDVIGGGNFIADQSGATRFVTMTVIPEPSVPVLLGGLGVLGLLRRRR
jgi:autotransporter-associated beta strand protein